MSSIRLPSNSAGRSNGVPCSYLLVKFPCKSGSPHGVFGGTYVFAEVALTGVLAGVCAPTATAVIRMIAAADETRSSIQSSAERFWDASSIRLASQATRLRTPDNRRQVPCSWCLVGAWFRVLSATHQGQERGTRQARGTRNEAHRRNRSSASDVLRIYEAWYGQRAQLSENGHRARACR